MTKEGCSKIDMSLIPEISSGREEPDPGRMNYSLLVQLMWALESQDASHRDYISFGVMLL